jgi:hypothetical protein
VVSGRLSVIKSDFNGQFSKKQPEYQTKSLAKSRFQVLFVWQCANFQLLNRKMLYTGRCQLFVAIRATNCQLTTDH